MSVCGFSEDRDCNKREIEVKAKLFFGNQVSLGTATGISEHCICINTRFRFPLNSWINLLIPFEKDVVNVPCEINGFSKIDSLYDTMNIKITNPPEEYLKLVSSFQSSSQV